MQIARWLVLAGLVLAAACGDNIRDGADGDDDGPIDARAGDGAIDADPNAPDAMPVDGAPNSVTCGDDDCDLATEQCCVEVGGSTCIPSGDTCGGTPLTCDGPEDCPEADDFCCGHTGGNASAECATTCQNGVTVCHDETQCAEGELCCPQLDGFSACIETLVCLPL